MMGAMNERLEQIITDLDHDASRIPLLPDRVDAGRVADIEKYANRLHGAILRASAG